MMEAHPLLDQRVILVDDAITDEIAQVVIAQILFLRFRDGDAPIQLYLASPGGLVTATLAIFDTIEYCAATPAIHTHVFGDTFGAATLLAAAGARGHRFIASQARIGAGPFHGATASESHAAEARDVRRLCRSTWRTVARLTSRRVEEVEREWSHDFWLSADEARSRGYIDHVRDEIARPVPG